MADPEARAVAGSRIRGRAAGRGRSWSSRRARPRTRRARSSGRCWSRPGRRRRRRGSSPSRRGRRDRRRRRSRRRRRRRPAVGPGAERVRDVFAGSADRGARTGGEEEVDGADRARSARSSAFAAPGPRIPTAASWRRSGAPGGADDRVGGVEARGGGLRRAEVGEESDGGRAGTAEDRLRGPGGAERLERVAEVGSQRERGGLEVVDEQVGIVERRGAGAGRLAQARGERVDLRGVAAEPEPVGLGEDGGGAEAAPAGSRTAACSAGSGSGSTRSPTPRTKARAGRSCEGTSAPSCSASSGRSAISPAARRRTAAASPLPPPRPAATGTFFSISIRSGSRSQPAHRSAASAFAARFSPSTPGQRTSSRLAAEPRRSGRRARAARTAAERVQTVLAGRPEVEAEVELGRRVGAALSRGEQLRGEGGELLRRPAPRRGRPPGSPSAASAARAGPRLPGEACSSERASDLRR